MTKKKEFVNGDPKTIMDEIDRQIEKGLNEAGSMKSVLDKLNNFDLVFGLLPVPILHEIYRRLEEGQKAIEENKRIKASLDAVANQIKSMFKLV